MMTTLSTFLVIAALTLGFLALLIWQAQGDEAKVRAVPVKRSIIAVTVAAFSSLLAGFLVTNISANNEALKDRGLNAAAQIDSYYALVSSKDSPADDIIAGDNDLTTPEVASDLASGRKVVLDTKSGKDASLQLFSEDGKVVPVLMYDGKEDTEITWKFRDRVENETDYPQLIPLPALPAR
ncbi:hypothetical protein ACFVGV_17495 [Pseudarthrobacter scleromae]|uniref:hypothetical protein n=1 Tax=Pseudarthrobacter scleromae TaxID=158897 RepID=UPI0036449D95